MKAFLAGVLLLLTALPGFGGQAQPGKSNQFRVKHSRAGNRDKQKTATAGQRKEMMQVHPGLQTPRPPQPGAKPAHLGKFSNRLVKYGANSSSIPSVSLVAASRSTTGGESDDEQEPVVGDFNGDGKKDVAKIVSNVVASVQTYSISVMLGNGDGTFQTAVLTDTPSNADDPIIVGDVDGDGKDDILMVHPFGGLCASKSGGIHPLTCGQASVDVFISKGDGTFQAPVNYNISPNNLVGGVLTDMNGDGKLDVLAFDDQNPGNALELLNNGDGTFAAVTTYATLSGPAPGAMFFADFNGDGKLDFAGYTSNQLSVFLASGSNWAAPVDLTTEDGNYQGCFPTQGDLNGDGKPEIIQVDCDELNYVTVYMNNGDGTFAPGVYYNLTGDLYQFPSEAAIGDINGDGNNDIIVTNEDGGDISVLLGHGDGTFTAETVNYDVGGFPWMTPIIADFNGDGILDVVADDDYFNMVFLQSYGDGTFKGAPTYELPNSFDQFAYSYSVATGDFNGDGIPDLAVGQNSNDGSTGVVVYLGKGDGTFFPGVSYGESTGLGNVAVGDFNGDGKLDIAVTDNNNGNIQILLGNGDGTFAIGLAFSSGGAYPQNLVVGDFNHDGILDIAVPNAGSGNIGVLLGNGDGTFAAAVTYDTPGYNPQYIAMADIDGDGYLDLAVTAYTDGPEAVGVFLANNDSTGTFKPITYTNLDGNPEFVWFGDLDGDGKLDMAVSERDGSTYQSFVEVGLGAADGTFGTLTAYPTSVFTAESANPANIQMADINGDGKLDLVYVNEGYGTIGVMYGNGDGTLNAPVEFPANEDNYGLAVVDLDGDGAVDVVTANDYSGGPSVLLNGNGSASAPTYVMATQTPSQTVTAGQSGTYQLSLAGRNGYTGTITFACSNLPTGAACSFSPSSVIANAGTRLATTLTISTTGVTAAALKQTARPGSQPGSPMLLASFGGIGLVGLVLAGTGKKGRQRRAAIVLGFVLLATLGLTVACDNENGTKTVTSTATPAGAYNVTVTSTGTGTNAPTQSVHVVLVVQ